jgi:hypothetical protein
MKIEADKIEERSRKHALTYVLSSYSKFFGSLERCSEAKICLGRDSWYGRNPEHRIELLKTSQALMDIHDHKPIKAQWKRLDNNALCFINKTSMKIDVYFETGFLDSIFPKKEDYTEYQRLKWPESLDLTCFVCSYLMKDVLRLKIELVFCRQKDMTIDEMVKAFSNLSEDDDSLKVFTYECYYLDILDSKHFISEIESYLNSNKITMRSLLTMAFWEKQVFEQEDHPVRSALINRHLETNFGI